LQHLKPFSVPDLFSTLPCHNFFRFPDSLRIFQNLIYLLFPSPEFFWLIIILPFSPVLVRQAILTRKAVGIYVGTRSNQFFTLSNIFILFDSLPRWEIATSSGFEVYSGGRPPPRIADAPAFRLHTVMRLPRGALYIISPFLWPDGCFQPPQEEFQFGNFISRTGRIFNSLFWERLRRYHSFLSDVKLFGDIAYVETF